MLLASFLLPLNKIFFRGVWKLMIILYLKFHIYPQAFYAAGIRTKPRKLYILTISVMKHLRDNPLFKHVGALMHVAGVLRYCSDAW